MIQKSVYPMKPEPNLLTWMEKELIKYLHKQDSSEWTVTRLSESFPATEDVIRKVNISYIYLKTVNCNGVMVSMVYFY